MNLEQVLEEARNNKKIRRTEWEKGAFIRYKELCMPEVFKFYIKKDYQDWEVLKEQEQQSDKI